MGDQARPGKINSILGEIADLRTFERFFDDVPAGINCQSGFIAFDEAGKATLLPHNRAYRQRHVLPGHWAPGADGTPPLDSLLHRYLDGIFRDDAEAKGKLGVLQELVGSAATGYATKLLRPKAAVLIGPLAENGKSQFLELARGMLPLDASCSISPSKVGHDYFAPRLVGKLLNASDEASSAEAIGSEIFKAVVTGEPVSGRPIYERPVEFRSKAQHIFALNILPAFKGGMDRGVRRRLVVVPFNRVIPVAERIENIGGRIAVEESDLLLAWAVEGAARLIRQREFTEPVECKAALQEWLLGSDPVEGWLEDAVQFEPVDPKTKHPQIRTRDAYAAFKVWALGEGHKEAFLPAQKAFTDRVRARDDVGYIRTSDGRFFLGMVVRQDLVDEVIHQRERERDRHDQHNIYQGKRSREGQG